jgi:alpha-tubulin suppressor-like RCC1 family protein
VSYPDRRAYCWGRNRSAELGDGTTTDRWRPVAVFGARQFRQVAAAWDHSCGLTSSNDVFCWGNDENGQLGDGSEITRSSRPSLVAGGHKFRQMDVGFDHSCGVTTANRAFCWGSGGAGQIGDGKTLNRFVPRAVAGGLSFERVSPGQFHTCGETTTNRAYCWGSNIDGGLGDGTAQNRRLSPVAVSGGLNFSQVSAGFSYSCGRTPSAVAYCWGRNSSGELGDGTRSDRHRPTRVASPM